MRTIRIALLLSSVFAAPVWAVDVSGSWHMTVKAECDGQQALVYRRQRQA